MVGWSYNATTIENCYTTGTVIGSSTYVGGLTGRNETYCKINNSYSTANVSGVNNYVGGLAGSNESYSSITNCYSTGSVNGSSYVGGIAGDNESNSSIINSYSTGSVNGSSQYVGGIAGYNYNYSIITNCYNRGNISSSSSYVGGIIGYNFSSTIVSYCYSTGSVSGSYAGGLVGKNSRAINNCFWDITTSGTTTGIGGGTITVTEDIGEPTDSMQTESTFTSRGWDFTSTWNINGTTNGGYPYLQSAVPLPVELTTFTGVNLGNKIELQWNTATEVNNYGFEIQRSKVSSQKSDIGNQSAIANRKWAKIGFVKGRGNSNSPKNYSYIDDNPLSGTVEYRLKQIGNNGNFKYSQIVTVNSLPTKFELYQNYPNPFNPTTAISYQLPAFSHVTLKIYDVLGREVETLVNKNKPAGKYTVEFNGEGLASGVYFYKLTAVTRSGNQTGDFSKVKKLMLLK